MDVAEIKIRIRADNPLVGQCEAVRASLEAQRQRVEGNEYITADEVAHEMLEMSRNLRECVMILANLVRLTV